LHDILQEEYPEYFIPSIPIPQMVEKYKQTKENENFEKQSKFFEPFFTFVSKNLYENENVVTFLKEKDLKQHIQNSKKGSKFLNNVKKFFSVRLIIKIKPDTKMDINSLKLIEYLKELKQKLIDIIMSTKKLQDSQNSYLNF
jgi:hypothetical protein